MSVIDQAKVKPHTGSSYPEPYGALMDKRSYLLLGAAAGLTQFGANIAILQPGGMSSMRHWHMHEDEFVMVTQGEVTLVMDEGETVMRAGDCAAFPAGVPNGHHFLNRTSAEARFLVIGTDAADEVCTYSDIDMMVTTRNGRSEFTRKDGSPMPGPSE